MNQAVANRGAESRSRWLWVIASAGVSGGVVDAICFSASALLKGKSPVDVLQSIASFWLGPASKDGGAASALLGAATHFGLATIMATGYFVLSRFMPLLRDRPFSAGALYGVGLYVVMYYVIMPIRWPAFYPRIDGWTSLFDVGAHIGVGMAIAVVVRLGGRQN